MISCEVEDEAKTTVLRGDTTTGPSFLGRRGAATASLENAAAAAQQ
jgi:hypothetical protein